MCQIRRYNTIHTINSKVNPPGRELLYLYYKRIYSPCNCPHGTSLLLRLQMGWDFMVDFLWMVKKSRLLMDTKKSFFALFKVFCLITSCFTYLTPKNNSNSLMQHSKKFLNDENVFERFFKQIAIFNLEL